MRSVQVNLFQKRSFLHQLTHNMTTDCSLNYEFSTRKIQVQNILCTKILNLYFSGNSMNNLSSYCGLTDSRMRASDTDLPVCVVSACENFVTPFCEILAGMFFSGPRHPRPKKCCTFRRYSGPSHHARQECRATNLHLPR